MKSRKSPHGVDAPGVKTTRVRKLYVGGVREEARLDGIVAQIGTHLELLGASTPSSPDAAAAYDRAGEAYFLRFPSHPHHWAWRHWPAESPWLAQLNARDGDPATHAGYSIYRAALLRALKDWRAAHPRALAVHPESVHWSPAWDALEFDPDLVWPPRNAFLMTHEAAFRAAPGDLWGALRGQLAAFMAEHYEAR